MKVEINEREFGKALNENRLIFSSMNDLEPELNYFLEKNGIKDSNFLCLDKPYELKMIDLNGLIRNKSGQGVDAVDENGKVWEVKSYSKEGKDGRLPSLVLKYQCKDILGNSVDIKDNDAAILVKEGLFAKGSEDPFEDGKYSGGLLVGIKNYNNLGFSEILKIDSIEELWDKKFQSKFEEGIKKGTYQVQCSYNKLKKFILNEEISGEIYDEKYIQSLEEKSKNKRKGLYNCLNKFFKFCSEILVVNESFGVLSYERGIDPFNNNDLSEFYASLYSNSLCIENKQGPDAIDINGRYVEFKVISPNTGGIRVDKMPEKGKGYRYFLSELKKKFILNGESILYYIFIREGQEFKEGYSSEGSILFNNREYRKLFRKAFRNLNKGKTKDKVNVNIPKSKFTSSKSKIWKRFPLQDLSE